MPEDYGRPPATPNRPFERGEAVPPIGPEKAPMPCPLGTRRMPSPEMVRGAARRPLLVGVGLLGCNVAVEDADGDPWGRGGMCEACSREGVAGALG